jgi:Bacterial PH domain
MIGEHDNEPIPGLPGFLPAGEEILWQGSPEWKRLAMSAFHVRGVALYFAALSLLGAVQAAWLGTAITIGMGLVGLAVIALLAWGSARTTLYTLTNKRVVMRIGIALPKCINLPLTLIGSADLSMNRDGTGDIPLHLLGPQRLGYVALWPHARPWKISEPQPMLRALPDAQAVAAMLARACGARLSIAQAPAFAQALAA